MVPGALGGLLAQSATPPAGPGGRLKGWPGLRLREEVEGSLPENSLRAFPLGLPTQAVGWNYSGNLQKQTSTTDQKREGGGRKGEDLCLGICQTVGEVDSPPFSFINATAGINLQYT